MALPEKINGFYPLKEIKKASCLGCSAQKTRTEGGFCSSGDQYNQDGKRLASCTRDHIVYVTEEDISEYVKLRLITPPLSPLNPIKD
jgi:hypothetical protein